MALAWGRNLVLQVSYKHNSITDVNGNMLCLVYIADRMYKHISYFPVTALLKL